MKRMIGSWASSWLKTRESKKKKAVQLFPGRKLLFGKDILVVSEVVSDEIPNKQSSPIDHVNIDVYASAKYMT